MTSPTKRRTTDADARIGAWLRQHRTQLGLTQAQMGELIGVTYQQFYKYEAGENRISAGRLLQLLQVLGVDLAEFTAAVVDQEAQPVLVKVADSTARLAHECVARLSIDRQAGLVALLGGGESGA